MAETLEPDADGGLTLLIQHDSPSANRETNWLPAPAEGFFLIMRMYQPEERCTAGSTPSRQSRGRTNSKQAGRMRSASSA
jgi:hypothetical protein